MKKYFFSPVAILRGIVATTVLKASEQFTKLIPGIITIIGYAGAFYLLGLSLRSIPMGVAYAIWSGAGIVFIALIGILIFKQQLDWPAVMGLILIISGVFVINVFSRTAGH